MERFPEEALDRAVRGILGPGDYRLVLSPIPSGKFNTSYFVDGWEMPLVLRIAPPDERERNLFYEFRMMRQEPRLHALIREKTGVPVAKIISHVCAHPEIGRDLLLMERLPGSPLSERNLAPRQLDNLLYETGRGLAQVHEITSDLYGYAGEHRPMEAQRDWRSAFAIMWNMLLDDIEACGGYGAEEAGRLRRLLDRHVSLFDTDGPARLLHMDVWAQNLLCDAEGELTGLVDWDRALWGDPEIEFAVLDYCGISEPAFWEGYGAARDLSPEAKVRHLFYFLYELQKYIFIRRVRGGGAAGAERYKEQALALAAQLE